MSKIKLKYNGNYSINFVTKGFSGNIKPGDEFEMDKDTYENDLKDDHKFTEVRSDAKKSTKKTEKEEK